MTTSAEHLLEMAEQYNIHTPEERATILTDFVARIATRVISFGTCPVDLAAMVEGRDAAQALMLELQAERDVVFDSLFITTVATRSLTSNVATIALAVAHNLEAGNTVTVTGLGSPFDGAKTVASAPTSTTLTYAAIGSNVAAGAAPAAARAGGTLGVTKYMREQTKAAKQLELQNQTGGGANVVERDAVWAVQDYYGIPRST